MTLKCECADRGCPVHHGVNHCTNPVDVVLYRVDMEDNSGVAFCEDCAKDAMQSGLFTDCMGPDYEDGYNDMTDLPDPYTGDEETLYDCD